MRLLWAVFCSRASIDRVTNNLSLLEVIEELTLEIPRGAPGPDGIPLQSHFVCTWGRDNWATPEQGDMQLKILDPSGGVLVTTDAAVDLQQSNLRMRVLTEMSGFKLNGDGVYSFEIGKKDASGAWLPVHSLPVLVRFQYS